MLDTEEPTRQWLQEQNFRVEFIRCDTKYKQQKPNNDPLLIRVKV